MKKAGCISISYGVESGSPRILKNIQKHITVEQIIRASEITKKSGIQMTFFLIVGSPGENEESINETICLLEKTKPHSILVSIMNLTPDVALCHKQNIPVDEWFKKMLTPIYYTTELNFDKLEIFVTQIHKEFEKNKGSYSFNELVQRVRQNSTTDFQAFNYLGTFYLGKGLLEDALICFVKAIEINPGYAQAHNNLGVVLARAGKKQKAIEEFEKAIRQNPEDVSALNNLGRAYLEIGLREKGKKCFENVLIIDSQNKSATENLERMNKG